MSWLYHTFIYTPLYNALVFFINIAPLHDVGIAIILLTIFVKTLLFPLAQKMARSQLIMKKLQPELDALKEKYKNNKQKLTEETFALYKKYKINPFFGIVVLFIQLPVIIGLYWVFYKGGLPNIDPKMLYSFIHLPTGGEVNMNFLGLIDMSGKSVVLALLAGVTQFINTQITMPTPKDDPNKQKGLKDEIAKSMHMQMKYVMPVFITVIAYSISSAVALYWVTSNLYTIAQELYVRKRIKFSKD